MPRHAFLLIVLLVSSGMADEPTVTPDGFPLPPGAVRRFGNRQLRHGDFPLSAVISADGKLLATVRTHSFLTAGDSAVVVWDLKTLSAKRILTGVQFRDHGAVERGANLAFLPDSSALFVGICETEGYRMLANEQGEIAEVWDVETGKRRFAIKAKPVGEVALCLTAGGKEIALIDGDAQIRFFDVRDGKPLRTVPIPKLTGGIWVAEDGSTFASEVRKNKGLVVFNLADGKEIYQIADGKVRQAALSSNGRVLAYVDQAKKVRARDLKAGKDLAELEYDDDWPTPSAFSVGSRSGLNPMRLSADGKAIYFGISHGNICRWDLETNKSAPVPGLSSPGLSTNLALSPDGSLVVAACSDNLIHRWDLKAGKELPPPPGYIGRVTFALAMDGRHLFVGDRAGQLDEWDLTTGKKTRTLAVRTNKSDISSLDVSQDGKWLAVGRYRQQFDLWDVATGKLNMEVKFAKDGEAPDSNFEKNAVFAADGKVVYYKSATNDTVAWDLANQKQLWNVSGDSVRIATDPKGRWVAACFLGERSAPPWSVLEAKTGEIVAQIKGEHETGDLTFTSDGSRIVSCDIGGTVAVFDAESRKEIRRFAAASNMISCSPDGKWVAAGSLSLDLGTSVWELATGKRVTGFASRQPFFSTPPAFTRDGRGLITNPDLSPILWDLCPTDLPTNGYWEALASDDAAKAYKGQWALIRNPATAIKLLVEQVKPTEFAVQRKQFDQLVADLDNSQFSTRETAEKELTTTGVVPHEWLRKALADSKSDEQRTRLARILLQRQKEPTSTELRLSRSIQVLELIASEESKALLQKWSAAVESPVAADAKDALGRLASRP
jgi:WD40 repeat protein